MAFIAEHLLRFYISGSSRAHRGNSFQSGTGLAAKQLASSCGRAANATCSRHFVTVRWLASHVVSSNCSQSTLNGPRWMHSVQEPCVTNSPAALMLILILHLCRITAQALLPPPSLSVAASVSYIGHLKADASHADVA